MRVSGVMHPLFVISVSYYYKLYIDELLKDCPSGGEGPFGVDDGDTDGCAINSAYALAVCINPQRYQYWGTCGSSLHKGDFGTEDAGKNVLYRRQYRILTSDFDIKSCTSAISSLEGGGSVYNNNFHAMLTVDLT